MLGSRLWLASSESAAAAFAYLKDIFQEEVCLLNLCQGAGVRRQHTSDGSTVPVCRRRTRHRHRQDQGCYSRQCVQDHVQRQVLACLTNIMASPSLCLY
jgi:hypothetical protein